MTRKLMSGASIDDFANVSRLYLSQGIQSSSVRQLTDQTLLNQPQRERVRNVFLFVRDTFPYTPDPVGYELLRHPDLVAQEYLFEGKRPGMDCVPEDTKIICKKDNMYAMTPICDLHVGDEVLSFNFHERKYEFKPVINVWYKGKKPVFDVKVKGTTSFKCTANHKLFCWSRYHSFYSEPFPRIEVLPLSEIMRMRADASQTRSNQGRPDNAVSLASLFRLPIMRHIKGPARLSKDELWLEGIYAAEGYKSTHRQAFISNDNKEVQKTIMEKLVSIGVPYNEPIRERHAFVTVKNSSFAQRLQSMGENSFDKHFLDSRLSLSRPQLRALLDGYCIGDGWVNKNEQDRRAFMYTTSSDRLAMQLQFMHFILGQPLTVTLQIDHQGAGTRPIWRLYGMRDVDRKRNHGDKKGIKIPGQSRQSSLLGKRSIGSIKDAGEANVFDIQVADNRNFVHADTGILLHNCDDHALMSASMLGSIGFQVRLALMDTSFGGQVDHAIAQFKSQVVGHHWPWINVDPSTSVFPLGHDFSYGKVIYIEPN